MNPLPFDRDILRSELMQRKEYLDMQKKRPYANPTAMFKNHQDALNMKQSELDSKLSQILKGEVPRVYGEMPKHLGKYERIAPGTKLYDNAVKLRRSGLAGRKSENKKQKRFNILRVLFPFLEVVAGLVIIEEDVRGMYQILF